MGLAQPGYRRLNSADSRHIQTTDARYPPERSLVQKTPASMKETDGYPLGLTYHSDWTADRANGQ